MEEQRRYKFSECLELFTLDLEAHCADKTMENYMNSLRYFTDYITRIKEKSLNEILIDDIELMDLNKYVVMLRNRNKYENHGFRPTQEKKISNTTIRDYSRDVCLFFRFCYNSDYMQYDITKNFKLIPEDKKEILPLYQYEVDQIEALFSKKTERDYRNMAIIHCMLDAGMRSGEVVRLKDSDVNFKSNYIFIDCSKGYKSRYVKMSYRLKNYLLKYKTVFRYPAAKADAPLFFQVGSSKPITDNVIKQMFAKIKERTEIDRLKPHLLRHTFASSFMCGCGNLESLRDLLGHSSYTVTQKYIHMSTKYKSLSEDIYKLDRAFLDIYYIKR